MMQQMVLPLLTSHVPLHFVAERLGAHPGRFPFHPGSSWPDQLAWGLDSITAAVRLMLSVQPIGASVIARTQIERWSTNIEFNIGTPQQPGEDTVARLNRLWSTPGIRVPKQARPVGDLFADLSELLHARGPLMPLVWLDIADVTSAPASDHAELLTVISDCLGASLGHVSSGLATAALTRGWARVAEFVGRVRLVAPTRGWTPDLSVFLFPMGPRQFQNPNFVHELGAAASGFRRAVSMIESGDTSGDPAGLWPLFSLGHHRFRALVVASHAYEQEKRTLGEQFGRSQMEMLAVKAVLAGEMAAMLAVWLREDPTRRQAADAFAVCASGLRSAEWLWLEDDPRAMGCLRCVIEQVARARTWRLKPARAAKIDSNPNSTPRDWMEGAGWRRLNLLSRALGEFVHGSTTVSWELPRRALVALQRDADVDETAQSTGRTNALRASIFIVAAECARWVDGFGGSLGEAYRNVVGISDEEADRAIEELMRRAWEKRGLPLR
ncbi:hypothetical protein [Nocardia salmonicida]|uniref:hypothetical protein n=1 Tax=Nocardia salmonicida TaxID=53431 RepID=UPI0037A8BF2A